MKRTTIAAVAAVFLLTLTGCAETAGNASGERVSPAAVESAEPLAAETPAESPSADTPVDDSTAQFLTYVRENLYENTVIPDASDDQLIAAGEEACDRMAAGEASDTISVIEGEPQNGLGYYEDSGWIISGAGQFLCPAS